MFLEEAAGVSKYRERRRETENRLEDTRENLARVDDIRARARRAAREADAAGRGRAPVQGARTPTPRSSSTCSGCCASRTPTPRRRSTSARSSGRRTSSRPRPRACARSRSNLESAAPGPLPVRRRGERRAGRVLRGQRRRLAPGVGDPLHRRDAPAPRGAVARSLSLQLDQWTRQRAELRGCADDVAGAQGRRRRSRRGGARPRRGRAGPPAGVRGGIPHHAGAGRRVARRDRPRRAGASAWNRTRCRTWARSCSSSRRAKSASSPSAPRWPSRIRCSSPISKAGLRTPTREIEGVGERVAALQDALPGLEAAGGAALARLQELEREASQLDGRLAALQAIQARVEENGEISEWLERHGLASLPRLWQKITVEPGWEQADRIHPARAPACARAGRSRRPAAPARRSAAGQGQRVRLGRRRCRADFGRACAAGDAGEVHRPVRACAGRGLAVGMLSLRRHAAPDDAPRARARRGAGQSRRPPVHPLRRELPRPDSGDAGILARQREIEGLVAERETFDDRLAEVRRARDAAEAQLAERRTEVSGLQEQEVRAAAAAPRARARAPAAHRGLAARAFARRADRRRTGRDPRPQGSAKSPTRWPRRRTSSGIRPRSTRCTRRSRTSAAATTTRRAPRKAIARRCSAPNCRPRRPSSRRANATARSARSSAASAA